MGILDGNKNMGRVENQRLNSRVSSKLVLVSCCPEEFRTKMKHLGLVGQNLIGVDENNLLWTAQPKETSVDRFPEIVQVISGANEAWLLDAYGSVYAILPTRAKIPLSWSKFQGIPPIKNVFASDSHRFLVDDYHRVWAYGCNAHGELGLSPHPNEEKSPQADSSVPQICRVEKLDDFTYLQPQDHITIAIDQRGNVISFGGQSNSSVCSGAVAHELNIGVKMQAGSAPLSIRLVLSQLQTQMTHDYSTFQTTLSKEEIDQILESPKDKLLKGIIPFGGWTKKQKLAEEQLPLAQQELLDAQQNLNDAQVRFQLARSREKAYRLASQLSDIGKAEDEILDRFQNLSPDSLELLSEDELRTLLVLMGLDGVQVFDFLDNKVTGKDLFLFTPELLMDMGFDEFGQSRFRCALSLIKKKLFLNEAHLGACPACSANTPLKLAELMDEYKAPVDKEFILEKRITGPSLIYVSSSLGTWGPKASVKEVLQINQIIFTLRAIHEESLVTPTGSV